MRNGLGLDAPLRDPARGEGVPEVGHPRAWKIPVACDAGDEPVENGLGRSRAQGPAGHAHKEGIGEGKTATAQRDVTIERLHGGGVQGNRPLWARLEWSDAQLGSPRIEIGELQLACFARANAGARHEADEGLIRERM